MGVAATLPELSEWTLMSVPSQFLTNSFTSLWLIAYQVFYY